MKEYTLTTVQAGELVGKHHTTIARYIRDGMLDAIEVDAPRWTPKLRVNREDVLAIWKEKQQKYNKKKAARNKSEVRMEKYNSPRRTSHKGEVWDVIAPDGEVVYTGTFAKCLKEKPAIELQARQYHTMQMRGGRREMDNATSVGQRWEQIDRYNFGTV